MLFVVNTLDSNDWIDYFVRRQQLCVVNYQFEINYYVKMNIIIIISIIVILKNPTPGYNPFFFI